MHHLAHFCGEKQTITANIGLARCHILVFTSYATTSCENQLFAPNGQINTREGSHNVNKFAVFFT